MKAAIEAGIQIIGENKIQDAEKKFADLSQYFLQSSSGLIIEKHFIGHLQTNKAKKAIQIFDVIESVDSMRLLEYLNKLGEEYGKKIRILLEVNIAQDQNKQGFTEKAVRALFQSLPIFPSLHLEGLMTIVPWSENPENTRPYFRAIKKLFEEGKKIFPGFTTISMGMSHDFEVAIEEGSTEIRVGSYLLSNDDSKKSKSAP